MRYEIYGFSADDVFGIKAIGWSTDRNVTHFGPFKRNNYIIHYVLSGQGYFNNSCVRRGQGFLITPQMQEHYYSESNNPWGFVWIIFDNNPSIGKLFNEYNADTATNIFEYNNFFALDEIKNIIIKNNNHIYRSSELYEMFLHIFNNHSITQKNEISAEEMYYNHAINFIELNLYRKVTVSELTEVLGVSQPYLYNIFINRASVSPKQYIDIQKTEKAKQLLANSSMPLVQVANSVGMEDCITFSKFFKKRTGLCPSDFRKELLK